MVVFIFQQTTLKLLELM